MPSPTRRTSRNRLVVDGLSDPTGMAWAPDGRLFIIEKDGSLKVAAPGARTATEILDLSEPDQLVLRSRPAGARPGLGLRYQRLRLPALHQRAATDHRGQQRLQMISRLDRIQVSSSNVVSGRTTILGTRDVNAGICPAPSNTVDCIPSNGTSHSIGSVRSAPDGTLWVGSGDAASFSEVDPFALGTYNTQSMAGKIMHVDRNGRGVAGHPFCSTDTNLTHVCTKIWARGFRNPFRFKLRPGGLDGGRRRLGHVGGGQPRPHRPGYRWPVLRVALLRGRRPHQRLPGSLWLPGSVHGHRTPTSGPSTSTRTPARTARRSSAVPPTPEVPTRRTTRTMSSSATTPRVSSEGSTTAPGQVDELRHRLERRRSRAHPRRRAGLRGHRRRRDPEGRLHGDPGQPRTDREVHGHAARRPGAAHRHLQRQRLERPGP